MATVTPGIVWVSGETVTPAKLNSAAAPTVVVANNEITTAKILDANVTDAKLATGAVTGAAGGGKLAASAITGQTQKTSIADADELLVHSDSDSALRRVAWSSLQPVGTALQTVVAQDDAYQSLTWSSNWGVVTANVALVSTAGAEVLSGSITPASASNKVLVTVSLPAICANTSIEAHAVLFRGTEAIQATVGALTQFIDNGNNHKVMFNVFDSPNTSSSVTYSVRVARVNSNTGTIYINGTPTGAAGGGAYKAVLTLQEIKA
jgi:hypothetical protein